MWQRTLKKITHFEKKKCSKCVKFGFKSMDFEKTIKDFGCYKCPSAFLLIKLLTCIALWKKYYINPDMVFVLNRFCFRQCKCLYVFINPVWCGTCISLLGTGREQPKFQYNFQLNFQKNVPASFLLPKHNIYSINLYICRCLSVN